MNDAPSRPAPRFDVALSVFFPCYNEQENVERVTRRAMEALNRLVRQWEIILVDDGSADETGRIADRLAAEDIRIRAVHHERNGGYGRALRTGFAAARLPYVFYTDGDGQFDISELDRLLERIGEAEIVSGYRARRRDGFLRRLNAAGWSWLTQRTLGFRCRDVDSAFKLYRREIFGRFELKSTGALIDAEVLARAVRCGCRIVTVPVTHLPRRAGKQTGAKLRVILRAFRELWQLRRDIRRGR
ncbi:MAG TPA: glycosyltransferase family 2 protein [Phycisphaerales bacterium]|nr:glycosyltransferase family 2 protein [Phycisphaerales bacterium]